MALTKDSFINMNDGHRIPVLGFGTYAPDNVPKSHAKEPTKVAIDAGFRHIDSAFVYQNEVEVGEAIREKIADGTVKREEIFYTSKLWSTSHSPELVRPALMKSLKALQLDYIDLYLIHWPKSLKPGEDMYPADENGKWFCQDVDLRTTWEALEACKDEGLVRSIGVSNFTEKELEMILDKPGLKHKPVCNQVECHVYLNQKKMLEFCKSKDIVLVAYSVLGSSREENWISISLIRDTESLHRHVQSRHSEQLDGNSSQSVPSLRRRSQPVHVMDGGPSPSHAQVDQKSPVLLDDPLIIEIGQKYKKSSAQVAMRYLLQQCIVVLAKSFTPERIKQNIQVFDFHLTPDDMKTIDGLNRNLSYLYMSEAD